jgi:hypothetical protein
MLHKIAFIMHDEICMRAPCLTSKTRLFVTVSLSLMCKAKFYAPHACTQRMLNALVLERGLGLYSTRQK